MVAVTKLPTVPETLLKVRKERATQRQRAKVAELRSKAVCLIYNDL